MKRRLAITLILIFIISSLTISFAEKLEPIEDPKIYKKFDILENISKRKFKKRLEEQERILEKLEDEVDTIQYYMFYNQHQKNIEYFEENYKSVFTKMKERLTRTLTSFLVPIGFMGFMYLFGLVAFGFGDMSDDDWRIYEYLRREEEEEMNQHIRNQRRNQRR